MAKAKKEVQVDTDETVEAKPVKKSNAQVFTYVGGGEDSPRIINFMGMQEFIRGKATEVSNPDVLAKIVSNPAFVEGEVDLDELDTYDIKAKQEADKKRVADKALNAAYSKKHRTE